MSYDHAHEARGLLRFAELARNADRWTGDRNADSQAAATMAVAHALLALLDALGPQGEEG